MAIYSGFSHKQWWFPIVMLVYQRGNNIAASMEWDKPWDTYPNIPNMTWFQVDESSNMDCLVTPFRFLMLAAGDTWDYCIYRGGYAIASVGRCSRKSDLCTSVSMYW